jgi:hypothetical protein
MGYTLVKSFERGIDTRKLIDTTEPGTLIEGRDCHITLGGEIEKRAAFVVKATLPATTVGLWVTDGRVYHTWGDSLTAPAGLPPGTIYHGIPDPDGSPLDHIMSVEEFNSLLYVIAHYEPSVEFPKGRILHWYGLNVDGSEKLLTIPIPAPVTGGGTPPVTAPGNKPKTTLFFQLMATGTPPSDVIIRYIYLLAPGSTHNFGPTGTVDAWLIVNLDHMEGTFPISNIIVPGPTNPREVAAATMNVVNSFIPPVGGAPVIVTAQASEDTVLFWLESPGPTYNGWKIEMSCGGPCLVQPSGQNIFSGGTTSSGGGTVLFRGEAPSLHSGAPGDPVEKGTFARAHSYRMFSTQGSLLNYSAPKDPSEWLSVPKQAGAIEHSMLTSRKPILVSMADYGGDLAVFGTRHVFVWNIDVTPGGDQLKQTLHGTGTFAPHSVVPYGTSDVMYLDISGVRSLRARDSSEQAFAADVGNLIDDLVRAKIDVSTDEEKFYNYWAVVEPRSGRLWMALHDKIFILSYYTTSRISAWTWYDATSAPVDYMVTSDQSIYWRSGNDIIIYGDESGTVYDDTEALARLPYIDGGKPATAKNWTGIDLAIFGTWNVRGSFDPTVPTALDLLANLTKSTYAQQKIAMNGESPAVSLELRSTFVGPARVGNAALHYTDSTAD